jgi:hypothetical protein
MSALVYNFAIPTTTKHTDTISDMKTPTHQVVERNSPKARNDVTTVSSWGALKLIHR